MQPKFLQRGFTLLEILISVAVVGILVAIAYPLYRNYQAKARASDIVVKYDAVRSGIGAELAQGSVENCVDLSSRLNPDNFRDPYARLAIGYEKGSDGYRAVFVVCAEAAQQGALGIAVAREAHGVFTKTHGVEKGAVLTDSVTSFAVPIATAASAVCRTAPANPSTQCGIAQAPVAVPGPSTAQPPTGSPAGGPVVQPTGTQPPVAQEPRPQPQAPQPVQPRPSASCPPGYRPNPQGHCVPDHGNRK